MRNTATKLWITDSRLSYELGLHGEKISMETLEYEKWT